MFDIMQIRTKFMRGILAKFIGMMIYKKIGYKVKIDLDDINIKVDDEIANVYLKGGFSMNVNELKKFERIIDEEIGDL